MEPWALRVGVLSILFTSLAFGQQPDRITEAINPSQMVPLPGKANWPGTDLGRLDGQRTMEGVRLAFRLSPAQQADLDQLLSELQDRNSTNYHKFLTPAQYAKHYGMSQNDINKIIAWLQLRGFTNIAVANSHNEVSFDGTVAQVERTFAIEMHSYLVNGDVHFANSTVPSIPSALAGTVMNIAHLNTFAPKPRAKAQPHLTSYVTGDHYLTPDDFATIYDVTGLYNAGSDGTGQKIVIVGQSTVSPTDLSNFRTNAGLSANPPTLTLIEGTGTRCSGDEFESDLDLEWSGGVAKNASITFLYAGLGSGDTCSARLDSVWDALDYAVEHNVAPFISTSYGYCEQLLNEQDPGFIQEVQSWAQQGQSQGQTIVSASGDAGAADCDSTSESVASQGLAVDVPASIPEVTGAGGNEFFGDSAGTVTGDQAAATTYWSGSGAGTDAVDTALSYIPEEAWNDTSENDSLSASGGGASVIFSKPTWQTGTGVPGDGARDVPDVSVNASPDHDPYLICSEDDPQTGGTEASCVSGFRNASGGDFTAVGGTSAAAPTFTAIMALVNQYVGNSGSTGLAPINQTLYTMPGNNPNPFHDVTTGNNIVPCQTGTFDCTTGSYGFSAGVGYDRVTGLGSVDAYDLAQIWARTPTSTAISASSNSVNVGTSVTFTATVTPSSATGTVSFYNNDSTTALSSSPVSSGTATFTTSSLPQGSDNITAVYSGDSSNRLSTSPASALIVGAVTITFTSSIGTGQLQVTQGTSGNVTFTIGPASFLTGTAPNQQTSVPVTYACSAPEATGLTCTGPLQPTQMTSVSFAIQTSAPTAAAARPFGRGTGILYAVLFPGLVGIFFTLGSRRRAPAGLRMVAVIALLGFSTLWLGSCSGTNSSSTGSSGTPVGQYTININATTASGPSGTTSFTLNVVAP